MTKVIPLYNKHFFRTIHDLMIKENRVMFIDGGHQLWHINDVKSILSNEFNLISVST